MGNHATGEEAARRTGEAGFTLLELLVVLTILALLAALVGPQVLSYLGGAQSRSAQVQIENISSALDLYRLDNGAYPNQHQGLGALVKRPEQAANWQGPYLKKERGLTDPWGKPYRYRFPGEHGPYDVYSLGADKAPNGEKENADVVSW
jgi:general secretion pathway protein G